MDLLDLASYRDGPPHALYRRLRAEDPVHWHPEKGGTGFWALTRHADVVRASRDSATFSSALGGTMVADSPPEQLQVIRLMMLNMDPPAHTKLRALINKGFTPRMVERLRERIAELAAQIVDRVAGRGECDFVADVAGELPSYVIAELTGIPLEDGRELYRLTERMHTAADTPEAQLSAQAAAGEMMSYSHTLRVAKRERPGEDIASRLLAAEIDGERLSDLEFDMFFMLLINAGGDTTRNLVAAGMLALIEHPDQRARLAADPSLLPSAIEEMLRWVTPVVHFRRTATRDAEIRGRRIGTGDKVVVFYASANRDEEAFVAPDRFDVGRTPNEHVAFGGGGAHFCLGANLARVEIRAMFEQVLGRLPDLALDGPVERLHSNFINGPRRMPVRFTPS
ncbi:MAG TPA: cytochrome P450 [Candidatus Bathyarchaeia archaeon]|nr:cytochrome P450 [Candidatus Bathyarchaeia archaeon]